jgi:cyanophycin synthetase
VVIYGLGNFVWNTPGRYQEMNAKPYGLAVTLGFHANRGDRARLRLYPILTDNRRTGFQNRPLTGAEFDEVAHDLTARLEPRPRTASDAIGRFLELDLILASHGQDLPPRDPPAGARTAPAGAAGVPQEMPNEVR